MVPKPTGEMAQTGESRPTGSPVQWWRWQSVLRRAEFHVCRPPQPVWGRIEPASGQPTVHDDGWYGIGWWWSVRNGQHWSGQSPSTARRPPSPSPAAVTSRSCYGRCITWPPPPAPSFGQRWRGQITATTTDVASPVDRRCGRHGTATASATATAPTQQRGCRSRSRSRSRSGGS